MNADQMANFMPGFQAQSYDNAFPLMENVAMEVGYAAGVWYHSTGQKQGRKRSSRSYGIAGHRSGRGSCVIGGLWLRFPML